MYATLLEHLARIIRLALGGPRDPRPQPVQTQDFLQHNLIRPQVTLPRAVRVLEIDLPAQRCERQLPQRLLVATSPQVLDNAPDVLQRHLPFGELPLPAYRETPGVPR
jgi:hypothetical protein